MPYVVRPRAIYYDAVVDDLILTPESITVNDDGDCPTVLVHQPGNPLWRVRDAVGFKVKS